MSAAEPPTASAAVRILIAEDSPTQARRLLHILGLRGYEAHAAVNGREALEMAAQIRPALLISDVVMPEMDGYELTRALKADAQLSGIPVILVTTMSDPEDVIRGLECGADCFILKPYDEQHLVSRIQYILLNREFRTSSDAGMGVEIHFNGHRHYITADRLQILNLLLSTYDAAIQRNRELSESKQALETTTAEVQAGHRFLDSMIENLPVPIFVQDAIDLRYVRLNRAAEQLMGGLRAEMIGRTAFELFPLAEAEVFTTEAWRALNQRTVEDIPWMDVSTLHNGVRSLRTRMVPVLDAFGDPTHLLMMADDVTESVKAAAELKKLNDELLKKTAELERARTEAEEATRAKSAFLATMSHEIRTPMNGVIGMVDVLHQSSLRGDQVEMVDLIRESAYSLLGIIEDILDFSKIEAGKLEIESAPMRVADMVEKACGLLDSLAVKKDVELTLFTDPAIPDLLLGDALRVRQVLINIVNNAIKFSSGEGRLGRVSVRAVAGPRTADQVMLEISVTDNGIGIDDATKARLFTSFSQADVSTTRRFGGTGLGLAISSHLVALMGGRLTVHSAPGRGATFLVELPLRLLPQSQSERPAADVSGLSCLVIGPPDALADDHATYLRQDGAAVERVADLMAAREWLLARRPPQMVWIIDAPGEPPPAAEVQAALRLPPELDCAVGVVLVLRCRRSARVARAPWTLLDGNVLSRRRFLRAVSVAGGRGQPLPEAAAPPVRGGPAFRPPTREEAQAQGRLVLVAEDNDTNQKVIVRQLGLLGIAADVVGNGEAALARWRDGGYAALLTDLHMPVMDGYELTAALRAAEGEGRHTPVIALSANAVKDEADRCRSIGMDDYLSKPVRLDDLEAVLARWLPLSVAVPPGAAPAVAGPPVAASAPVPSAAAQAPAVPAAPAAPPVDVQVLQSLVGNDPALIDEFLQEFERGMHDTGAQIRSGCRAGQAALVAALAHRLKSSARAVGALALGDICDQLDQAGREGRADLLLQVLPRLEAELTAVESYLKQR